MSTKLALENDSFDAGYQAAMQAVAQAIHYPEGWAVFKHIKTVEAALAELVVFLPSGMECESGSTNVQQETAKIQAEAFVKIEAFKDACVEAINFQCDMADDAAREMKRNCLDGIEALNVEDFLTAKN